MNVRTRNPAVFVVLLLILPVMARAAATVPAGTTINVTIDQGVSSKDAKVGQTITGTVARDVVVDGKVVSPKGSRAKLAVSSVQASGRLSTPAKLWLRLRSVTVHGKTYDVGTNSAGKTEG